MDQLLPPRIDPERVRVHVVDNPEWNATVVGIKAFLGRPQAEIAFGKRARWNCTD